MKKPYIQHKGKVISVNSKLKHVMAIALDPTSKFKEGVVRCITSRDGDVSVAGYIDRSTIHKINGDSLESFKIGDKLKIKNEEEVIKKLTKTGLDFIGLEDPDIWVDEAKKLTHLYFTLPLISMLPKPCLGRILQVYFSYTFSVPNLKNGV